MPTITRTFTVTTTPEKALAYLEDFGRAEEWDPGTVECTRIDDGAVAVGARWRNTSKLAGVSTELTYTLAERDDEHVKFVGENSSATTSDTLTVRPVDAGSEVTYVAVVEMSGLAKLASPALKAFFEAKVAGEVVENLTRELSAL